LISAYATPFTRFQTRRDSHGQIDLAMQSQRLTGHPPNLKEMR
jgi:hypothetical protein